VIPLLTRDRAIQLLRENQDYLRDEFGVSRIGLFGSVARDQSDDLSDVDVVVEFNRPAIRSQHVSENILEGVVYV